jgi:hypothetical protein
VRLGFSAALDHLWIEQYSDVLRSTPVASQWIDDYLGKAEQYTVSLNIPNLGINASTLMKLEDEFEIVFEPKVDISKLDPETGEHLKEPLGWEAVVVERNTIQHSGTYLVKVFRRYDGSIPDPRPITSRPAWFKYNAFMNIFIRLKESTKTVKARLNALNSMHPDATTHSIQVDAG